jgi:hypothetical protein
MKVLVSRATWSLPPPHKIKKRGEEEHIDHINVDT